MDYKKIIPEKPGNIINYKKFSVAIILQDIDGQDHIILQKRSPNLNSQPSEISFPGGAIEEGESEKDAAIRESCEELLIEPKELDYYGQLDSLQTSYGIELSVFLMRLNRREALESWNRDEVEKILYLPLSEALKEVPTYYAETCHVFDDNFPFEYIQGGRSYPFGSIKQPYYFYPIEDEWIWGLTARIIHYFARRIKNHQGPR